jgi:hypothetical protein
MSLRVVLEFHIVGNSGLLVEVVSSPSPPYSTFLEFYFVGYWKPPTWILRFQGVGLF